VFAERRQRFVESMGSDSVAIVQGANTPTRSNDTEYPFRQNSDFWYLTGFEHPGATAVFRTTGEVPAYTLFVQSRDKAAQTWTGYRPGVEGATADYGADAAHGCEELLEKLPELLGGASRIYHSLGRRADLDQRLCEIQEDLRLRSRQGVQPASELLDPRTILHEMRLTKCNAELDIMRRAADISREAHFETARMMAPGRYEYELEATLGYVFRRRGGAGPAYGSIVAGGASAAVLHYVSNDRPLVDGELVLIDAGVELEGYASDVTRTYPVNGHFEGVRGAIYDTVLTAQRAALLAVRPGATLPAIHDLTVRHLVEGMLELGLMQGEADELIEKEAYKRYYMHGTSHWLGLDVHDVGSYVDGEKPRDLAPGMVLTVEPGIYVRADDEEAPEALRGIGVRIEDDVVVTADGCENLTRAIPKDPADVEAWMRDEGA
jgi:Xaa-Pro aminopeptidase